MADVDYPLTQEEFKFIYSKVPRLTVEIIVKNSKGEVFLTKRAIEPCKGQWHLPGGTVHFGESVVDTVKRIAGRELGIEIVELKNAGFVEYPSHYLKGLDSPIGLVFEVVRHNGELSINEEASQSGWFSKVPENMHADQGPYLIENKYLRENS